MGPYHVREEALQVASPLQDDGYPVFVSRGTPCYVQVGAFSNPNNAGNLESELLSKGFPLYCRGNSFFRGPQLLHCSALSR